MGEDLIRTAINHVFGKPDHAVLFVCTANVCRSPMAEGLLRRELEQLGLARDIWVDSAGTHAAQPGRPPDPRARNVCLQAGVNIGRCRARQVRERDFHRFDYIFAMEPKNYWWLVKACPENCVGKISLLGSLIGDGERVDIPDPYFSNYRAFDEVLRLLERAVIKVALQFVEKKY